MSYARTAVTRMTLDMSRPDLQRSETVTLGDTNRRWEVTIINGGAPFRLPPNWTAALTGIKPDGTGLLNGCSVADGKIIYDFAAGAEIATCAGNYPVQFDIWDEVGELVASPKVYVNVLADGRPHAELDSEGQYTLIGDLIGRVNQTDEDVDLLGETALAQGDDIADLKEKITTAGSVTIPTEEWSDNTPRTARFKIDGFGNGMTALLYPSDEETRKEASRVKLSAYPQLYMGTEGSQVEIVVSSAEVVPTKALNIDYIVIKTDNTAAQPRVALIGVDAYGEGGGGTASGVDETAVKKIINSMLGNVANVRQYSADNPPPYPVTSVNGKTGAVILPIPSKASDINAEEAGAVSTHNADQTAHPYLSERVATALDRISVHDTNIEEINTSVAERLKTADLAAKLDAYKAAQGLVSKTTTDLTNYYLKNEVYTKEEVAALISAIPKFEIKVVSSLPTANISLTTVYLVKDTTEGGGLYTEYIYVNGAWEELGSQNLDLSGYVTDEELDNLLKSYATLTKVSELIADALKPYATDEEVAEAIRVATVNFVTGSQVTTAINEALKSYYTSAQVDAQIDAQIKTALAGYVPKEEGKGLSSNDYTDADKAAVTKAASDSSAAVNTANQAKQSADNARATALAIKDMADSGELDGKDGTTPIPGVDYPTTEQMQAYAASLASDTTKVVTSVEEMTDTAKLYLMARPEDGALWYYANQKVIIPGGKLIPDNALETSIDIDGTIFNGGLGYKTDTRLSSNSGGESGEAGFITSGFIPMPYAQNSEIRIKGVVGNSGGRAIIWCYDSSFTKVGAAIPQEAWITPDENGVCYCKPKAVNRDFDYIAYIRFCGIPTTTAEDVICTIDDEITYTQAGEKYEWKAIQPKDATDHTADILALQQADEQHTADIAALKKAVENVGSEETTYDEALERIKTWDKPVYDDAPVTLLGDDRIKAALTSADFTIEAIYARYRALRDDPDHPENALYITETPLGPSTTSDLVPGFTGKDILRFDFCEPVGLTEVDDPSTVKVPDPARETKPKIIFISGIHKEWAGVYGLYYALEEIATNPDFDDIRRNAHIIVIPCANPFGMIATANETVNGWAIPDGWASHVNANGIAPHNNFGVNFKVRGEIGEYNHGGTEAYSELETQYIDKVVSDNPDAIAFITCHNYNDGGMFGDTVMWASSATYHMCNLVYRLVDKMSKAWIAKYGDTLKQAIDAVKHDVAATDYRLGCATMSTSAGTEQANATKYGILATNLEISDNWVVFTDKAYSSEAMTHGAETYANFIRTILRAYDRKDREEYAPTPAYTIE